MFEEMTYEAILNDMLSRVTNDVDKREGSVIYDALAPCAYQLAQNYFNLNNFIDLVSGDTAVGVYLDRVVADYGITRKKATKAVRQVVTTSPATIGSRWGLNDSTYTITDFIKTNEYKAECEQYGDIGNLYTGILQNIDNVSGVTAALGDILTAGQDEETDFNLRERYFNRIRLPSSSGNANHYREWALEVSGIGDAKVFPLWNGPGTVKVVILDSDKQPVGPELIQETAEYIENVRPVGAQITVVSGTAKTINISAVIVLAPGYSLLSVTNGFIVAIDAYFQNIAFRQTYISYAKIGTILLDTEGVTDYSDLKLNDANVNIFLADEEIPSLGAVDLEV